MIYNKADPERGGRERCLLVGGKEKVISGGGGVQKGQAGGRRKNERRTGTGKRKIREGRQRKELDREPLRGKRRMIEDGKQELGINTPPRIQGEIMKEKRRIGDVGTMESNSIKGQKLK